MIIFAIGIGKTVIVLDVIVLSHPVFGSPVVNLIVYVLSVVFDVFVNVMLLWWLLYVCITSPF